MRDSLQPIKNPAWRTAYSNRKVGCELSTTERRNIADAIALCEDPDLTPSPGLITTIMELLMMAAPSGITLEKRNEIPGLWNWTLKLYGKDIVDVAWGRYTYGFPFKVEIMGLLLPSEAQEDDVISVTLGTFVRRYRAYRDHPSLFIPMWKLTKTHKRE